MSSRAVRTAQMIEAAIRIAILSLWSAIVVSYGEVKAKVKSFGIKVHNGNSSETGDRFYDTATTCPLGCAATQLFQMPEDFA